MSSARPRLRAAIRPKDRRAQIMSQAAALFWRYGYDGVTVADVAAAVGITAAAVYKHVPGKQALLVEPIREMVMAWYASALVAVDGPGTAGDRLDRLSRAVVLVAIDRPDVVGLWHRESRHLPEELRDELVALRSRTVELWTDCLTDERPDLDRATAQFRIRAALGLLNSVALLTKAVSRARTVDHFESLIRAVLFSRSMSIRVPAQRPRSRGGLEVEPSDGGAGRREALLVAGAALFRQHGYHRVGIDDIGAAAGIRGPSVYGHFASKADVLCELLTRMADLLDEAQAGTQGAAEPRQMVETAVAAYVSMALANRDLVAVHAAEIQNLPGDRLRILYQRRQARTRAWTVLLCRARPDLEERTARISVLAVQEMIFSVARSHRWDETPGLDELLESLSLSALLDA